MIFEFSSYVSLWFGCLFTSQYTIKFTTGESSKAGTTIDVMRGNMDRKQKQLQAPVMAASLDQDLKGKIKSIIKIQTNISLEEIYN